LAGLLAKADIDGVRGPSVGKQVLQCIADAGRVADLGEGLDEPGVNRDAASALMEEFKPELATRGCDRAGCENYLAPGRFLGHWNGRHSRQETTFLERHLPRREVALLLFQASIGGASPVRTRRKTAPDALHFRPHLRPRNPAGLKLVKRLPLIEIERGSDRLGAPDQVNFIVTGI
jgi:hypothetical protein